MKQQNNHESNSPSQQENDESSSHEDQSQDSQGESNDQQLRQIGVVVVNVTKMTQSLIKKPNVSRLLKNIQVYAGSKCDSVLESMPERALPFIEQFQGFMFDLTKVTKWQKKIPKGLRRQKCIQKISHINFSCLKHLDLRCSNISNIEVLSFIDAPNLGILYLFINKISNPNALIKANFPKLYILYLTSNCILRGGNIYRWSLDNLQRFFIDLGQYERKIFSAKLNLQTKKYFGFHRMTYTWG